MQSPLRRERKSKPGVIKSTLDNPAFCQSIEKCLVNAADNVFDSRSPYYLPAFVGHNMNFYSTHFAVQELGSRGFRLAVEQGQLRVRSETGFAYPITITFWGGVVSSDGIARSRWPRGTATKQLVRLNEISNWRLQPSLFDEPISLSSDKFRELHIGVVHNTSVNNLTAWAIVATEWINSTTLQCG